MNATRAIAPSEVALVEEAFERIASDLSMVADRDLAVSRPEVSMTHQRPIGHGDVHVSFKLDFRRAGARRQGALLVPRPAALAMAGYLLMLSDQQVEERCRWEYPDAILKEALTEIDHFVCASVASALEALGQGEIEVSAAGCQGVRAGVRPALDHRPGEPLIVGWCSAALERLARFRMALMFPACGA